MNTIEVAGLTKTYEVAVKREGIGAAIRGLWKPKRNASKPSAGST